MNASYNIQYIINAYLHYKKKDIGQKMVRGKEENGMRGVKGWKEGRKEGGKAGR